MNAEERPSPIDQILEDGLSRAESTHQDWGFSKDGTACDLHNNNLMFRPRKAPAVPSLAGIAGRILCSPDQRTGPKTPCRKPGNGLPP
jgi:hypothetical protein